MLARCIYITKAVKSVIKTRSPTASLPFKGQATEQTTVKWSGYFPPVVSSLIKMSVLVKPDFILWLIFERIAV